MPALSDNLVESLVDQYLETPTKRAKLAMAMVDAAEEQVRALRGDGEPDEGVIERIRNISRRLMGASPVGGLPPMLQRVIPELESAWHDYQNLPRPGRYRTLAGDDEPPPSSSRTW